MKRISLIILVFVFIFCTGCSTSAKAESNINSLVDAEIPVVIINTKAGIIDDGYIYSEGETPQNITVKIPVEFKNSLSFYKGGGLTILGPKGMSGEALVGTSGTSGLTLSNNQTSEFIEVSVNVSNYGMAVCSAAPYFQSAKNEYGRQFSNPLEIKYGPPKNLKQIEKNLAMYTKENVPNPIVGIAYYGAEDALKTGNPDIWSFISKEISLKDKELAKFILKDFMNRNIKAGPKAQQFTYIQALNVKNYNQLPLKFKLIVQKFPNNILNKENHRDMYYLSTINNITITSPSIYFGLNEDNTMHGIVVSYYNTEILKATEEILKIYFPIHHKEAYQDLLTVITAEREGKVMAIEKQYDAIKFKCSNNNTPNIPQVFLDFHGKFN